MTHNPALDLAPFGRWTLRDEAAQRRSAPRWATRVLRWLLYATYRQSEGMHQ